VAAGPFVASALLLCAAAARAPSWAALRREARATPSPNGGWPMGAMALLLDVRLRKPGIYQLNGAGADCAAAHTRRALEIARRAVTLCAVASGAGCALVAFVGGRA